MDGSPSMQVWVSLFSYLRDREDMKWGGDHREEMEGEARVAMVKIH